MRKVKIKVLSALLLFLVGIVALSGSVSALSAKIDWVKVDNDVLSSGLNTIRDLERGNTFPVKVQVTSAANLKNVEVEGMVSGYDHNDRVTDVTDVFDMKTNVSYVKKLKLSLPSRMDQDRYRLRIYVRDRNSDEIKAEYYVQVDTVRHKIVIKDVDVDPSTTVDAGRSLRVLVDLKNYGQLAEDSVKIQFAIPELNLKSLPDYVDIKAGESKDSEELYVRVPPCTKAGQYKGRVSVTYDDGDETETKDVLVNVVASSACAASKPAEKKGTDTKKDATPAPVTKEEKTVITVGAQTQTLTLGKGGAIYPITFTNTGSVSKTYVVGVSGADSLATVKISPLQTVTVSGSESQSVYVYVSAKETAKAGKNLFSVSVKDASGKVVKQIPMTADVKSDAVKTTTSWSKAKVALEIALVVLVVILIIVGLVVAFSRKKDEEDEEAEDEISGQTYY